MAPLLTSGRVGPLLALWLSANPGWPGPADLEPALYADPAYQPDDPGYAPGPECQGQRGLYSFRPSCLESLTGAEPNAVGGSVDRAWTITTGRPDVVLAVVGAGFDPADPELVGRIVLNPGELPAPDRPDTQGHDANQDLNFTVLDFTSATGTQTPDRASVRDRRLLARADRGDVDGNGLLDPRDLLAVFGDGVDNDGDGLIDDVAGWDFVDDDPDVSGPGPGAELAHQMAAAANDGRSIAGVCPRCGILLVRAASAPVTRPDVLARALGFVRDRGAVAAAIPLAVPGPSPSLIEAAREVAPLLTLVVGRGQDGRRTPPWPPNLPGVRVGSVGLDQRDPRMATRAAWPDPRSSVAADRSLMAPGAPGEVSLALVTGTLGLLHSAAREDLTHPPLTASRAEGLLLSSATDLTDPPGTVEGYDRPTGFGRVDAEAALRAWRAQRPTPTIEPLFPAERALLDPSPGASIRVQAQVRAADGRSFQVEAAAGQDPRPEEWVALASGVIDGDDAQIEATLPPEGWSADPTRAWSEAHDGAVTLRFTIQGATGRLAEARRVVFLHRDLDLLPAFPRALGNFVATPPRIGQDRGIWIATIDGTLLRVDAKGITTIQGASIGPVWAAPSLSSDDQPLRVSDEGGLYDGEVRLPPGAKTSSTAPGGQTAAVVVADWDGDGKEERILARADGHLVVFGVGGDLRLELLLDGAAGTPAVGDLDGDGRPELVVATARSLLRLGADGRPLFAALPLPRAQGAVDRGPAYLPSPALADLDLDGRLDVAVAVRGHPPLVVLSSDPTRLRVVPLPRLGTDGQPLDEGAPGWTSAHQQLAVADLDADEKPELLLLVDDLVRMPPDPARPRRTALMAVHPDGEPLPGFPRALPDGGLLDFTVVDLDGDRRPEVLIPGAEALFAVAFDGSTVRRFPKLTGAPLTGPPAVGDLDGDGLLELAAVNEDGILLVWRTRGPADQRIPWAGYHHDAQATGNLTQTTLLKKLSAKGDGCGCRATPETRPPSELTAIILLLALTGRRRRPVERS